MKTFEKSNIIKDISKTAGNKKKGKKMNKSGNDRQIYVNKKINHVCYKGNLYAPYLCEEGRKYTSPSFQNLERLQEASQKSEFSFNDRVMIEPVLTEEGEWTRKEFVTVTSSSDTSKSEIWGVATEIIRQKRTKKQKPAVEVVVDNESKSEDVLEKIEELNNIILDVNVTTSEDVAV